LRGVRGVGIGAVLHENIYAFLDCLPLTRRLTPLNA
jgi:hypothetical protein